jgi:hypothetical protein
MSFALLQGAATAYADEVSSTNPNVNADVLSRARPEYDAHGIPIGSFSFFPSLTAGVGYTDNAFNAPNGTGDVIYTLESQLKLQSAWSRHELVLTAASKTFQFAEQESENRTDWQIDGSTRFDLVRGSDIRLRGQYGLQHEARGAELAPGVAEEPTEYATAGFAAEASHTIGSVKLTVGANLDTFDYEDTPLFAAPGFLNNDDRDRTVTGYFGKAAIGIGGNTAVFVRARFDDHDFETVLDDDGFDRDSTSLGVDGGLSFQMTHVLAGDVFVGYTTRDYADLAFTDTNEIAFGAALKWFPSLLTTISVDGMRSIDETSITGASGILTTKGMLGLDHELLRNLIFSSRLGYETAEYVDTPRHDDVFRARLGGRYLFNNNFHFEAGWELTDRSSSDPSFDYSTNQFLFSVTGKM